MADIAHLEKMERELKCPICLSLLKSAVSLTCNHVFCNSCIVESMRTISNCPVCKVPLRRREVRPAPHMDNLVSIYRSMEAASDLNIFTSQVTSAKHSDIPLRVADDKQSSSPNSPVLQKRSSMGKKSLTRRKKAKKDDIRTEPCTSARPSFPSNKRIHVTPYPVSETPIQQKKAIMSGIPTIEAVDRSGLDNNKILTDDMQEDPSLPLFFWLRDRNEKDESPENLITQESTGLSPTASAPCFSDIKDSDDCRTPKNQTPNSKCAAKEYFDSEIFQWTQRDCSPELFLTPAKKQDAKETRSSGLQEDEQGKMFPHSKNHSRDLDRSKACHLGESRTTKVISFKKTLKKKRKRSKAKKVDDLSNGTAIISMNDNHFGSMEPVERSRQESKPPQHKGPLRSSRKVNKKSLNSTALHLEERTASPLKECNDTTVADKYTGASKSGIPNQNMEDASRMGKFPSESSNYGFMGYGLNLKNKFQKRTRGNTYKLLGKRKACSLDHSISRRPCTSQKISASEEKFQKRGLEKSKSGLQLFSCRQDKGEGSSRTKSKIKNIQTDVNQSRLDLNDVGVLAAISSNAKPHSCTTIDDTGGNLLCMNQRNVLKKCINNDSPTQCAFCHSSSVSEVTGEIMHYSEGKSVAADYNGGVNVIHSHKNCTEWAPEVYFKDDLVINLPTEVARSRRITCSCCGIKGAALGCFEKSCRKSFHYPCAKKTPECRWDYENFVMLCPLHYSSKLPCETSELQKQNTKRFASKGEAQTSSQSKATDEKSCMWTWPSGSPRKWVLCSSALSDDEKGILYEFARLTGISISRTWSSVVTHVITSTDEHGACKRTLKFLMGILEGKWILSIEWIKECMKFMKPVDEEKYEIGVDVHGIRNGPRLGRMRIINKEPKLFHKLWFYFMGDFVPSYKGYLQDLTIAAGGRVLQRRPISRQQEKLLDDSSEMTIIVYSLEPPENNCMRKAEAMALAQLCRAKVVTNSWILNSIAASRMKLPLC